MATILEIAKTLLGEVDSSANRNRVRLLPNKDAQVELATRANSWKSSKTSDYSKRVALCKSIASQILEPDGFVFFHIDADRPWADFDSSENVAQIGRLLLGPIRGHVARNLKVASESPKVDDKLQRLCFLIPCYSIESWLYQNIRVARSICERKHTHAIEALRFDEWESDRGALDEVVKPKENCCLGDCYNHELASNCFPSRDARSARKSFAATVDDLASRQALCEALARSKVVDWVSAG